MARHRGIKTQIFQGFLLLISRRILFLKQLIAKTCIILIKGPEPEKDAICIIYIKQNIAKKTSSLLMEK